MVDTLDLKSNGHYGRAGSSPAPGTIIDRNLLIFSGFFILKKFGEGCCNTCLFYILKQVGVCAGSG